MDYRAKLKEHQRIVIKIGTSSLTYPNGKLNLKTFERLSWVLTDLHNQGKEVVLVSSGAIGVGAERMGLAEKPKDLKMRQAAAAVGQAVLMQIYQSYFYSYNQRIGQILITKDCIDEEDKRINALNTFDALLSLGIIPIVNENDTVSTYEMEFSDNDMLSASVAKLIEADLLIVLTDIDGLYDDDPRINPKANRLSLIAHITEEVLQMGGDTSGNLGTGGMKTKVLAAQAATQAGIDVLVISGSNPVAIYDGLNGLDVGTMFPGKGKA